MAISKSEQVRRIRPLPERLINKIAAGEVIERPAAVVKELVENSLDAGADRIEVVIEKSGSKLIKIIDNGCGIPENQIEIAFSRHATSKIYNFNDLESISSYGFRGEALPSIASVSRMRMVSRSATEDAATEIIYEGGVMQSKKPVSASPGTVIEVENLFFNTPARRKFLKSEMVEARHISRLITALALGKYSIGFTYSLNGKTIFSLPPGQDLDKRISSLLKPGSKFLPVNMKHDLVRIEGYISPPDIFQSNRMSQYLFINGRFINSPSLSHAFVAGYGELMPKGKFPLGAILLTIDSAEIDVNVHPSKTEVKLSHDRQIYDALYQSIKSSLRNNGIIPDLKTSKAANVNTPYQTSNKSNVIPGIGSNKFYNKDLIGDLYKDNMLIHPSAEDNIVKVDKNTGEIIEDYPETTKDSQLPPVENAQNSEVVSSQIPELSDIESDNIHFIGRFSDLYLLFQIHDTLFIVDQHAAHERVLYEETLRQMDNKTALSQQLLFPVQVELTPVQLNVFEEHLELLKKSGFIATLFGGRMINIEALPSVLSKKSPEVIILKMLDDLLSLKKAGFDMKKAMAQSIACRAAIMAGDRLKEREIIGLILNLFKCENSFSCPHGRPTLIKMSKDDLSRQFGR